jgi:hypothetical protein
MTINIRLWLNWKKPMSKTFLILVLIFIANVAFANSGFVQHDKNTSVTTCNTDSETACNQDGNDIELDVATSLYSQYIPHSVNLSTTLANALIELHSVALITIRGPPYHYQ